MAGSEPLAGRALPAGLHRRRRPGQLLAQQPLGQRASELALADAGQAGQQKRVVQVRAFGQQLSQQDLLGSKERQNGAHDGLAPAGSAAPVRNAALSCQRRWTFTRSSCSQRPICSGVAVASSTQKRSGSAATRAW